MTVCLKVELRFRACLQGPQKQPLDSLRLVLVYLLTTQTLPTDAEFSRLESGLGGQDPDHLAALR